MRPGIRRITVGDALGFPGVRIEIDAKAGAAPAARAPRIVGRVGILAGARAVVACGHQTFRLNRIEAWTLPGNAASDRVLEKCGFRHEGVLRQKAWFKGAYHDFRMFGRVAGDPMR